VKAKKLLAALGALAVAIPGLALAGTTEISTVVEGHSVFAAVVDETQINFAAIAGIAAKRTVFGGVLWFNDQELFAPSVASELAAGKYVIATGANDDPPSDHFDAQYEESYQVTDPNNQVWMVDRYVYWSCSVEVNGQFAPVPCQQAEPVNDNDQLDLDSNGANEVDGGDPVLNTTKNLYVVTIGPKTIDSASGCAPASGKEYNFVLLVRMDQFAQPADGNNFTEDAVTIGTGTFDTAQVDLWFSEERPAEPATRTIRIADAVGDAAPCA
jgi:hypothetical protein